LRFEERPAQAGPEKGERTCLPQAGILPQASDLNPLISFGSRCFHHNAADNVGHFITTVGGIAEVSIDHPHLQHIDSIRLFEEIRKGCMIGLLHGIFVRFGSDRAFHGDVGVGWVFEAWSESIL
jgi:hypothetical protein